MEKLQKIDENIKKFSNFIHYLCSIFIIVNLLIYFYCAKKHLYLKNSREVSKNKIFEDIYFNIQFMSYLPLLIEFLQFFLLAVNVALLLVFFLSYAEYYQLVRKLIKYTWNLYCRYILEMYWYPKLTYLITFFWYKWTTYISFSHTVKFKFIFIVIFIISYVDNETSLRGTFLNYFIYIFF